MPQLPQESTCYCGVVFPSPRGLLMHALATHVTPAEFMEQVATMGPNYLAWMLATVTPAAARADLPQVEREARVPPGANLVGKAVLD